MSEQKKEEIVYIYFDNFRFNSPEVAKLLKYKPESGRVYRAIHSVTKLNGVDEIPIYKVITDPHDRQSRGAVLTDLSEDNSTWSFNARIVDASSISELGLSEDDLQNIIDWETSGNKEVSHLVEELKGVEMEEFGSDDVSQDNESEVTVAEGSVEEIINFLKNMQEDTVDAKVKDNVNIRIPDRDWLFDMIYELMTDVYSGEIDKVDAIYVIMDLFENYNKK